MSDPVGGSNLEVRLHGVFGTFQLRADFKSFGLATAVFGHSGAGKTSLIHMLAGLKTPHTGFIRVGDTVVFDSDEQINMSVEDRRVGMVFQDSRLFPHLSVERNLNYSNWAGGRKPKLKFDDVVGLLSLEGFLNRKPANLSGGEQQRVAIGRALLSDPRMLLLDEPLASLDNARKQDILPFIERIAQESHIPICYVSHSMDEVARIADDLVVLSRGKTIAYGPLSDILTRVDLGGATGRHEAGALVPAKVSRHDDVSGLTQLMLQTEPPLAFEITRSELSEGADVRLRIRARDVSLAASPIPGISIRNQLPAQIETIQLDDKGYAEVVLRLGEDGGGPRLRSRITAASVRDLELKIGASIYALIKSIAIERRLLQPVGEAAIPLPKLPISSGASALDFVPEPMISTLDEPPEIKQSHDATLAHVPEKIAPNFSEPVDPGPEQADEPVEVSPDPPGSVSVPLPKDAEELEGKAALSLPNNDTSDSDLAPKATSEPSNPFLMDAPPKK
ncbi:MAG: molybdenum ABC transporter ATP-binding protein [Hyphomicrobiales bacterium]